MPADSTAASLPAAAAESASLAATSTAPESFVAVLMPSSRFETIVRGLLAGIGLFAGFFYVPLAVFMQARPPAEMKGRMIGAMNLVNWIGIVLSAVFYGVVEMLCDRVLHIRLCWMFGMCALVMLPVALFYRPHVQLAERPA